MRGRMERTYWYWPGKHSALQASMLGTEPPARGSCLPFTTALIQNSVSYRISPKLQPALLLCSLFSIPVVLSITVLCRNTGKPGAERASEPFSSHKSLQRTRLCLKEMLIIHRKKIKNNKRFASANWPRSRLLIQFLSTQLENPRHPYPITRERLRKVLGVRFWRQRSSKFCSILLSLNWKLTKDKRTKAGFT